MELQIVSNQADKSYVINKIIEFNAKHFPDDFEGQVPSR